MGKSKKQKNKNASDSKERHIPMKKKLLPSDDKKLKKKIKTLSGDPNSTSVVVKPTISTSPKPFEEQKKKKKRNRPTQDSEEKIILLPLGKFFDSVSNVCDYGESLTFTDTKSFFKPEILVPEQCEIQCERLQCSPPELDVNTNTSAGNEDIQSIAELSSDPDDEDVEGLDSDIDVEDDNELVETDNIQFYKLSENKYLLETQHQHNLFIRGQLNIRVLFGSMEILGWCLNDAADKSVSVFSPRGCSMLCLQPLEHSSEKLNKVGTELTALGLDLSVAEEIVGRLNETNSLVIIERSESTLVSYLGQHVPSISLYYRHLEKSSRLFEIESKLNCQIQSNADERNCFSKSQDWEDLAETIAEDFFKKGSSRVVVCGGKAVGKSTLLRFLVNKTVQANGKVLFLDFDPGQPEFTAPGCVSVLRVNEPVLGPNYTHIRTPIRSVYLGHVNVDVCTDRYVQSVQHIIDYCQSIPELSKMVWLINTMGHNKGLGVELTSTVISLVRPSRVVQIESLDAGRNFPVPLLPENVADACKRWCRLPQPQLGFKLFQLRSLAEAHGSSRGQGLEPKLTRTFLLLAYFHANMANRPKKSLNEIIPYRVPLRRLTLSVIHEAVLPSDVLAVMNAALVALCEVGADAGNVLAPDNPALPRVLAQPPICPCVGFGVVRGVDVEARTLYLTTPLPLSRMATVDCLTTGDISLPPTLLLNAWAGPGQMPYVVTGPGQVTSRNLAKTRKRI